MILRWLVLALLISSAARAEETLSIFLPSGYLPPNLMAEFERRFHCKTVVDLFEDPESMLAKVQSGGASLYDVLVPVDYTVPALVKLKLLAPLRPEKIPNLSKLDSAFLQPGYDPRNKYTAAFQWGTVGILARKEAGKTLDESWGLFFDPAKQPGPIVLIDSMRDTIGAALKFQGRSFNSTSPAELKSARDLLVSARKRALSFANSPGGKAAVLDKSAKAAILFSSEGVRGMAEDPETVYFIPREGSEYWVDNVAIMAEARHRDLAEQLVNFLLEPEVNARISNFAQSCTPIAESKKLIDPKWLNHPAVYPTSETMKRLELLRDLGKDTRLYDQLWTSVKGR